MTTPRFAAACLTCLALAAASPAFGQGSDLSPETVKLPPLSEGPALGEDMDQAQLKNFNRTDGRKYLSAVRGASNPANHKIIRELGPEYVRQITIKENRSNLPDLGNDIANQLAIYAKGDTKGVLLETYADALIDYLYHKEPIVRMNAAIMLGQLNESPGGAGTAAEPYWPVYRALISVLEDTERTPAERLAANEGLRRILRDSPIPPRDRDEVLKRAADVLDGLRSSEIVGSDFILVLRVVELIGDGRRAMTLTREPRYVEALLDTVSDESQHWWTRSTALRAVSELRLEDDNSFDVGELAKRAAAFLQSMTAAFNKSPSEWYWKRAFSDVLLAFEPANAKQLRDNWGLLGKIATPTHRKYADVVNAAYDAALPLLREVSGQSATGMKPASSGAVETLSAFVGENAPGGAVHPRIN